MEIVKLEKKHVDIFWPHKDDIAEAVAAGVDWQDSLDASVNGNSVAITDGVHVIAIGGNTGDQCWFVTDVIIDKLSIQERRSFRKAIMFYREQMLCEYPVLWNYVWVGNKNHYRFLKSIGAEFHDDAFTTSPITGERFQLFTIRR